MDKKRILLLIGCILFSCQLPAQLKTVIVEDWSNAIVTEETQNPALFLEERLKKSKHFEVYTNSNGVKTYVLKTHLAEQQSTMYYTSPSISNDGKYMWFWLIIDNKNNLALIDFESDEVLSFPEMEIAESSSMMDVRTGDVYWVEPRGSQRRLTDYYRVYKRGTGSNDQIEEINRIPHMVDNCKPPRQVVTHFTYNASRTKFCFDSGHYYTNNKSYLGVVPVNGDPVEHWTSLDRRYNHAQMNPKYDDVMLAVQDYFYDYLGQYGEVGEQIAIDNRMWIIYSDGAANPVFPKGNDIYHEWWDADGETLWYMDKKGNYGGKGVCKVSYNYSTRSFGTPELIWANSLGHAATDSQSKYLIGDHGHKTFEATDSVRVSFFNIEKQKEIDVVTKMSYPGWNADPHPHFALGDEIICFTFSKNTGSTIAISFTKPLITLSEQ